MIRILYSSSLWSETCVPSTCSAKGSGTGVGSGAAGAAGAGVTGSGGGVGGKAFCVGVTVGSGTVCLGVSKRTPSVGS